MQKKVITIKEVAEHANVSQATVSRVINGLNSVKDKNIEKVNKAISELGYTPNSAAKALASNRSNSIGMLVGSLDSPFYGPLMHSAEGILYKNELQFIVTSSQDDEKKERDALNFLRSKQVDGAIVHTDKISDDELKSLTKDFKALVVLNRNVTGLEDECLYLDNELGGYIATKHLLDNGHKKIACITGPLSKQDARDRLSGYIRALTEYGVTYDPNLTIEASFNHDGNFETVSQLLDRDNNITAVFCQNDNIALAVYDVCLNRNLRVGFDISVVGFDNNMLFKHIRPKLTTVGFPLYEMGKIAGDMIIDQINDIGKMTSQKLTPEIVIRDSVKDMNSM